ncbi:MAG: ferrous iron transport protein B, partial [Actinobacteria bacterium]|nr:ferrous iron transport protein B [Actinomycetota bacterium]
KITGVATSTLIAESRYGFINGALKESEIQRNVTEISASDRIDQVLLNRIFGLPIFAVIMWAIFQLVFKIGDYPTRWLQLGFDKLAMLVSNTMPESMLNSLIVDGIIGGVGGVLIFTPKIMILFICIAVLEDSGYMARAAFIMDRIMHKIGLHGKSFIPMLIGFGCTVPAYMCSRTLENKNDRLITMHINTFMSCGGRLPIYILFAGTFFAQNAGNVIFSLYLIGIVMAVIFAKILRATRFKGESEPFVMELPVYRVPTFRGVAIHMWERTWQYIKKAGTVILAISIIIWILFSFPKIGEADLKDYNAQLLSLAESYSSGKISQGSYNIQVDKINSDMAKKQLEFSAAGRVGHFIEPVFKPLGFDWRLGLAILTGIAGKEVVVSTLGTTFSLSETGAESENLRASLKEAYNPLTGYNFMLFSLLYFPCIASLAVFQKEAGTKEMLFQAAFTLILAWVVSLIVYQIGRLFI